MPVSVSHSTPADNTFSAAGRAAWDAVHTISGFEWLGEYSFANLPAAASNSGKTATVTDIGVTGRSAWRSDGTRWGPVGGQLLHYNSGAAVSAPGDVNENVLITVTLRGGSLGLSGGIEAVVDLSLTSNANAKTLRWRLGGLSGTVISSLNAASKSADLCFMYFSNRGSASAQKIATWDIFTNATYQNSSTTAVDTTQSIDLVLTMQKASAGDTVTVNQALIRQIGP